MSARYPKHTGLYLKIIPFTGFLIYFLSRKLGIDRSLELAIAWAFAVVTIPAVLLVLGSAINNYLKRKKSV